MNYTLQSRRDGFSLIELVIAVAILGVISSLGMSWYEGYTLEAANARAINEIRAIDLLIRDYRLAKRHNPGSLADVGIDYQDPWGNDYQYTDIESGGPGTKTRKDKNLTPINTDYDLYSKGPDGESIWPLTAKDSHDDIVRANNGRYIGIAEGY
ncbi:MAG: type II secretion system protein [Pseudomonadales bacterium]|nr:type II secretion system protein [Pseudomonadales bacterium]